MKNPFEEFEEKKVQEPKIIEKAEIFGALKKFK